MVTQIEDPRRKQVMVLISTVAVTLVLALIVLFAAFSPPSPEGVVSDMLDSLADQDYERLQGHITGLAQGDVQIAAESQGQSRWRLFWEEGSGLFDEYRIEDAVISGDEATVNVFYGPGLIQEKVFLLTKVDGRWKVSNYND